MRSHSFCRSLMSVGFCALELGVSGSMSAQARELHQGDVARVSATSPAVTRFVGRVVALTADTIVLESDEPVARIAMRRSTLTSTEIRLRNGSRTKHAISGAVLGLITGAMAGAMTGYVGSKPCCPECERGLCGRGVGATFGFVGGGVVGLVAGTAIGLSRPVERWASADAQTAQRR